MRLYPPPSPHSHAGPSTQTITALAVGQACGSHPLLIPQGSGSNWPLVPVSLGPGSYISGGAGHSMVALWMPGQGPNLPECLADISTWNATWREVDGAFQNPRCLWHFPWLCDSPCSTFLGDLGVGMRVGVSFLGQQRARAPTIQLRSSADRIPSLAPSCQCSQGRLLCLCGWNCSRDVGRYGQ